MLPMLPNNFPQIAERIQRQNNRSLKDLFKNDIRGSFLIDIKYRVFNVIAERFFELYDLRWSDERMVTGIGPEPEYDICKHIVGVHKANTIFLRWTKNQRQKKTKITKSNSLNRLPNKFFLEVMVVHTLGTNPLCQANDSTTTPCRMSCLFYA